VYDTALVEPIAQVLRNLGVRRAFVVASSDGLDEFSLTDPTRVAEVTPRGISVDNVTPEEVGLRRARREDVLGGDAATNAAIIRGVLNGETGPRRDIVVFNAAAGILAGENGRTDWEYAVERACKSIDSGAALGVLERLVQSTALAPA
jgi:anthranilate phosphoribosyltransferase